MRDQSPAELLFNLRDLSEVIAVQERSAHGQRLTPEESARVFPKLGRYHDERHTVIAEVRRRQVPPRSRRTAEPLAVQLEVVEVVGPPAHSALEDEVAALLAELDRATAGGLAAVPIGDRVVVANALRAKAELYAGMLTTTANALAGKASKVTQACVDSLNWQG